MNKLDIDNTEKTLNSAFNRANELGIKEVVVASSTGFTAYRAIEIFYGFSVIVVTYHCGFKKPFEKVMSDLVYKDLISKGVAVVTATHALSGVERSLLKKYGGIYPVLLIADTLRLFGQGIKVAVEISVMASDSGSITGNNIVSIGGTVRGADTALLIKPAGQSEFFNIKIHEIICKPSVF